MTLEHGIEKRGLLLSPARLLEGFGTNLSRTKSASDPTVVRVAHAVFHHIHAIENSHWKRDTIFPSVFRATQPNFTNIVLMPGARISDVTVKMPDVRAFADPLRYVRLTVAPDEPAVLQFSFHGTHPVMTEIPHHPILVASLMDKFAAQTEQYSKHGSAFEKDRARRDSLNEDFITGPVEQYLEARYKSGEMHNGDYLNFFRGVRNLRIKYNEGYFISQVNKNSLRDVLLEGLACVRP